MDGRSLVIFLLIGLVAGFLASILVGGAGGIIGWLVAGVAGSFVGGWLARQFNISFGLGNAIIEQILISTIGAIIVLLIARLVT